MGKKALLIITDGIGYNSSCDNNAFCQANKKTYDYLFKHAPYSLIKTSGLSVGLPEGQMGNSEVGHMTIGSGRILYQNLVKITKALNDGSLDKNPVLNELLDKSKRVHIIGLLSDGGVHSHIDHIIGLAKIASHHGKKVFLHPITDGRDVDPRSGISYVEKLKENLDKNMQIASISGRFYTMDRDNRWERVKRGYDAIVNATPKTSIDPVEYLKKSYEKDVTDEFIDPTAFEGYEGMEDADGVIFANFRSDRMREITQAIGDENFNHFERKPIKVNVVTMTEYDKTFPYPVLFPTELPKNTLAEVISQNGLDQFHTAETEKYAHVTFFLNGGVEEPFRNETRVLIPSPKVKTYDLKPEMSAPEVGEAVRKALREEYDFVVVNFANGDMVGHTGDFEAAKKAVETVDREIGKILEVAKEKDYSVVITSDHGNVEQMKDEKGNILTNHTTFDVFCFVIDDRVKKVKNGGLNNIAPTILKLMGLEKPKEMDEALVEF